MGWVFMNNVVMVYNIEIFFGVVGIVWNMIEFNMIMMFGVMIIIVVCDLIS